MDDNLIIRIRRQLESEFYLMNDDWLRDCISYYLAERQNERPSSKEILEFVKAQWLLSDLREINNGIGSLPKNLSTERCTVLPGIYMLQVEQMYDIAAAKYKQLQRIRNTCTANIEATEVEESKEERAWSLKPAQKRMIQLKLTDGVQVITGIEHKPTALFNEMLLPGYKVLVKGPVKCRRGVLLLKDGSIEGVGGEVEHLLIPNAPENILARALNLSENPDPYNDNVAKKSLEIHRKWERETDALLEVDFDINLDEIRRIENSHEKSENPLTDSKGSMREGKGPSFQGFGAAGEQCWNASSTNCKQSEVATASTAEGSCTVLGESDNANNVIVLSDGDDGDDGLNEPSVNAMGPLKERNLASTSRAGSQKRFPPSGSSSGMTEESVGKKERRGKPPERTVGRGPGTSLEIREPDPLVCDYLCDVLNEELASTRTRTVRGRITYMEKLSKKDCCWLLDSTITDGTGSMDVSFSNAVLEKILGFSVKEFSRKKKMKNDNPEIEKELRQSLRTAEETLKRLDAMIEILLEKDKKPTVVRITELTEKEKQSMDKRLKYLAEH